MNILALTSAFPQPDDGNEIVTPTVKYFCEKWVELGHRVIVIHSNSSFPIVFYYVPENLRKKLASKMGHTFPTKESKKPIEWEERGVKCFRLPMVKYIPHKKFSQRKIKAQIDKIETRLRLENFEPDVILSHWINPQLEIMMGLKKIYNAKTSIVFHGDCSSKNIRKYKLKQVIKEIDAVGCRNKAYAQYVQSALELTRQPFICYSGLPDNQVEEQSNIIIDNLQLVENRTFVYVGRLVKYKNIDIIIKALNIAFPKGNFKFHIVGTGAERQNLENLVKELKLENQVIFRGQMPRDNVFNLMKQSFCFIMISDNETFGMVYMEAMLAGCITIASKGGGVDGIILDGYNGFLSEQGNTEALVEKLRSINKYDKEVIRSIRLNAVRTAISFSDSNVAKRYLEDAESWKTEYKL